jgi:hypothetical protein
MEKNIKTQWIQIIIRDEEALPGKNLHKIINLIKNLINVSFIILNDIDGAGTIINGIGTTISFLRNLQGEAVRLEEVLTSIFETKQFDWGDFFLFSEYPTDWNYTGLKLSPMVAQTTSTVRAVDDTYIYIYTPFEAVLEELKKKYEIESIRVDDVANLDYPQ